MASTHGRKPLPLPQSLVDGLDSLGFVEHAPMGAPISPRTFRLPRHPDLTVTVVTPNIPGESTVIAKRPGRAPIRYSVDALLVDLAVDAALADQGRGASLSHASGREDER